MTRLKTNGCHISLLQVFLLGKGEFSNEMSKTEVKKLELAYYIKLHIKTKKPEMINKLAEKNNRIYGDDKRSYSWWR